MQAPSRTLLVVTALAAIGAWIAAAPHTFAADRLESARSPLYRSTLVNAVTALEAASRTPGEVGRDGAANPPAATGGGDYIQATSDPEAMTYCIQGGETVVCTRQPNNTTRCNVGSNTFCAGDPLCGPTSRPPGRVTMCRESHTMCKNGEPIQCTIYPDRTPTKCPVSRTFCPGRSPGQGDSNCFTFIPGGANPTLCANAQSYCRDGQQVICTRDPMSTTQCAHSSRTMCPTDPFCQPRPQPKAGGGGAGLGTSSIPDSTCLLEPGYAPVSKSREIGLFCFGTYLVQGEMQAWFGTDIDVLGYDVLSSVESYARIYVQPGAALGPRLVLVHAGDDPVASPGAWGEYVVAVGLLEVVPLTPSDAIVPGGSGIVELRSNPNPFRSSTTIEYAVAQAGRVRLMVFDAKGRLVRRLAERDEVPGRRDLSWDGRDDAGKRLSSGVYFVVAQTASETVAWKVAMRD